MSSSEQILFNKIFARLNFIENVKLYNFEVAYTCFVENICKTINTCLGIFSNGNPNLFLNQQGNWTSPQAAPFNITTINDVGNGTNQYYNPFLVGANVLIFMIDGIGKTLGVDYLFVSATGTMTFGENMGPERSFLILYSS